MTPATRGDGEELTAAPEDGRAAGRIGVGDGERAGAVEARELGATTTGKL